jgi:deoxycytidylate deaminase/dephospho-CoA kinase
MKNYLHSAIDTIYRKDDELIIIGLTGRTGSGCSTVAQILCSEHHEIRTSLHSSNSPSNNDDRKEKIVKRHFDLTWQKFELIQVRSVITLFLIEEGVSNIISKVRELLKDEKKLDFDALEKSLQKLEQSLEDEKSSNIPELTIQFYTNTLPMLSAELKVVLGESAFIKLYQEIGKNIRLSGTALNATLIEGKFFTLAEKINKIIKRIVHSNKSINKSTLIVIDAIRSNLEAMFFQDRYAAFYLTAVSCPDIERKQRLYKLKFSDDDVKSIDKQEYVTRDLKNITTYSVQDIQACIQRADIYISNPDQNNEVSKYSNLSNQIIRFVSLMKRPGIVTPTSIERCMQLAYTAKLNSGCISRQVGAAITDTNFSVQAIGWNDAPKGQVPCVLRNRDDLIAGQDQDAYSDYEKNTKDYLEHFKRDVDVYIPIKASGRNISYCFKSEYNTLTGVKNQVHTRSLHAEENAFLQISKNGGRGIDGGILFTTASPCELCAKKAYQLGITSIYYIDPYPGIAIDHVIHGGTKNPNLILFSGAIGRAFHRLYSPILPYKDELTALLQK